MKISERIVNCNHAILFLLSYNRQRHSRFKEDFAFLFTNLHNFEFISSFVHLCDRLYLQLVYHNSILTFHLLTCLLFSVIVLPFRTTSLCERDTTYIVISFKKTYLFTFLFKLLIYHCIFKPILTFIYQARTFLLFHCI